MNIDFENLFIFNDIEYKGQKKIDFKKAVMYEAATGEKKFGANSPATANYILVWDDLNQNNNHLYNIKDYIESKVNSAKFNIGFKTAKDVGIAMRIAIK